MTLTDLNLDLGTVEDLAPPCCVGRNEQTEDGYGVTGEVGWNEDECPDTARWALWLDLRRMNLPKYLQVGIDRLNPFLMCDTHKDRYANQARRVEAL